MWPVLYAVLPELIGLNNVNTVKVRRDFIFDIELKLIVYIIA